ncbi:FIG00653203: hypothetical protein [hydrothermal vent metagenome]|uniref:Uncharacterized protein n=1 Tax=hydrothermal vent metagenome TaxID=652676 RepID=A0A3B0R3I3_9ZZZZ
MIKFFRKIRQNMIKENRASKYLLYAIGEIVLVVIGILIALSINNWNENRKEEIILKSNLSTILKILENDKAQLLTLIQSRKESKKQSTSIINSYKNNEPIDSKNFFKTFLRMVIEQKFDSDQSGFQRIKISKMFETAKMDKIRDYMVIYTKALEDIKFLEFRTNNFSETLESDLYHNGFYDKTWSYVRFAFDSTQFEKPKDSLDVLSLLDNYSKVKGLILRNEIAMSSAVKKYRLLIEKGNLLSEEVNVYLNN